MLRYRGHEIYYSGRDTKKSMLCYGVKYEADAAIYLIEGWQVNKTNPFHNQYYLTSIAACKKFIDEQIDYAGYKIEQNENKEYIATLDNEIVARAMSLGKLYEQLNS